MKKIVLTGFMATGKTAVGLLLAKKLGLPFLDTDELIEQKAGKSIPEIFAIEGEDHFRFLERDTISRLAELEDCIISTGGGAIVDQENLKALKNKGVVICLTASPEVILNRVGNTVHRPLLHHPEPLRRIEELLYSRLPFYSRADFLIDTSNATTEEVASRVLSLLGIEAKV